jgi:hypothetical protein
MLAQVEPVCPICRKHPPYRAGMKVCGVCLGLEPEKTKEGVMKSTAQVTQYDEVAEAKAKLDEQVRENKPCKSCGRTPDVAKFYPSRSDKCAECITRISKQNKLASNHKSPPVVAQAIETTPSEILPKIEKTVENEPESSVRAISTCVMCGEEFEPYRRGAIFVHTKCQNCLLEALKRESPSAEILRLNLKKEPELFDLLSKCAQRERRTLEAQALVILERALMAESGR